MAYEVLVNAPFRHDEVQFVPDHEDGNPDICETLGITSRTAFEPSI
jgi:hypothetical protein